MIVRQPPVPVLPHVPTSTGQTVIELPHSSDPSLPPLTFSSNFDSGNLASARQAPNTATGPGEYLLFTARDAGETIHEAPYSTWFHFAVSNARAGQTVHMCLSNMNKQSRLYKQDYRPFYKVVPLDADGEECGDTNNWQRLPTPCTGKEDKENNNMQVSSSNLAAA